MAITAGLLVQNALKKLLRFGETSNFVGYNAMQDFFPRYTLRCNPECANSQCRKWAIERTESSIAFHAEPKAILETDLPAVVHEDGDEWGIEIEHDESNGSTRQDMTETIEVEQMVQVGDNERLEDLAAQFAAL